MNETSNQQQAGQDKGSFANAIERIRQEFDRLMETSWSQGEKAADIVKQGWQAHIQPHVDIIETPETVVVIADIPGLPPEEMDVSLVGNVLSIKGTLPGLTTAEGDTIHVRERPRGCFSRSIPMPVPVDADDVTAEATQGVVKIVIKKSVIERTVQIKVNTNEPEPMHS